MDKAEPVAPSYHEQLATVVDIEHALASSPDQESTYAILVVGLQRMFPDVATILISRYDPTTELIHAVYGLHDGELLDINELPPIPLLPPGQGLQSEAIHTRQPILIAADLNERLRNMSTVVHVGSGEGITQAAAYVPMVAQDVVLGVIQIQSYTPDYLDEAIVRLLSLVANTAAASIQNLRLFALAQRELAERKHAEAALLELNQTLEERVRQRTAELARANHDLARAGRAKDEFLANMSHELRTPLNAILGISEMLLEQFRGPLNASQDAALRTVESSGRHLLALINDILDLSKVEANRLDLHVEPVAIADICEVSLIFVKEAAARKGLRLSSVLSSPVTTLEADPKRLKQMLVNLLSNAVKFTPEGGQVSLEVSAGEAAHTLRFAVRDSGIGIAPEDLSRLFQPFSQLDSSLSREHEGSGLGLALVRRLAELHGGRVTVESEPGVGSCFAITLPYAHPVLLVAPEAPTLAATPASDPASLAGAPRQAADPADARILIAEDNETNIETLSEFLRFKGYQVMVARNGREALEQVAEAHPDLILMDIQMPEMDGLEAIRHLRARPASARIPIIALTALAMAGDRERCLAAGANAYLTKPVSLKGLREQIEELLHLVVGGERA